MEMAALFTLMDPYMMVSGLRGILTVKAHSPSPMAPSMKVIGAKGCTMGAVPTLQRCKLSTTESGRMENITESAPSSGQMVRCTRVSGEIVRSTVGGSSSASMAPTTKENGKKVGTMDEVSYNYQEARYTLATSSMEGSLADFQFNLLINPTLFFNSFF